MSLKTPKIKEPEANKQLAENSQRLYNIAREQFDGVRSENRRNMAGAGSQTRSLQAKAGAGAMSAAGPAVGLYGMKSAIGPARQTGAGRLMQSVQTDQKRRGAQGQVGLMRDAVGGYSDANQHLGTLAGLQQQRNTMSTQRSINKNNAIGGLAGFGLATGMMSGSGTKLPMHSGGR
jgi:hypothetical protein